MDYGVYFFVFNFVFLNHHNLKGKTIFLKDIKISFYSLKYSYIL